MRLLIALVAVAFSGSVQAQQLEEKLALSRRVVSVLGLEKQMEAQISACVNAPADSPLNPAFEFKRNPGHFSGVSPQSAYWPQVEAAYQKYRETVCGYMSSAKFMESTAKAFADKADLDSLRAAVRFYESPEGRVFTAANTTVGVAMQKALMARSFKASREADVVIRDSLKQIADEYQRAPK